MRVRMCWTGSVLAPAGVNDVRPWRWITLITAITCLVIAWANTEEIVEALFTITGIILGIGAITQKRSWMLFGVGAGILTFAQRAWEIAIVFNGAGWQARVLEVCLYSMLVLFMLGIGFAYIRWEAHGGS